MYNKNYKKGVLYIILGGLIILGVIIGGIPLMARLSSFLGNIRKVEEPISKEDTTPPLPPTFENIQEFTSNKNIAVVGKSEPGALITYFVNNEKEQTVADMDGVFSFSLTLNNGENKISAKATDQSGNESFSSDEFTISFDDSAPELEVVSPEDGKNFYGTSGRRIVIEGKTEPDVTLSINDRVVIVESDGSFSSAATLTEGDNNFNFKAQDKAGNETSKGITLHFWK